MDSVNKFLQESQEKFPEVSLQQLFEENIGKITIEVPGDLPKAIPRQIPRQNLGGMRKSIPWGILDKFLKQSLEKFLEEPLQKSLKQSLV